LKKCCARNFSAIFEVNPIRTPEDMASGVRVWAVGLMNREWEMAKANNSCKRQLDMIDGNGDDKLRFSEYE